MFGIIRPCRNHLGAQLREAWMAHMCGLCLSLRDEHGQLARLVTNYDAVLISALVEAQTGRDGHRRTAGPCPLRGMRTASVATGDSAQLAAAVSLLLASAKIADHVADGDVTGPVRVRAARSVATRWAGAGARSSTAVGLDADALLDVVRQQTLVERPGFALLEITAPTEQAASLAFRQTAVVAGRPGNADALGEAGRLFGRLAHLLDAVEDLAADRASGAWNPILATGATPEAIRALCDDAVLGIGLAMAEVEFTDDRLVRVLLGAELERAVHRAFATAGPPPPGGYPPPPAGFPGGAGWQPPPQNPPPGPPPGRQRNGIMACLCCDACECCECCECLECCSV